MVYKRKALIEEANQALSTGEGCHMESDRRALEDMLVRAGKALSGETVPFFRNRELSLYFCRRVAQEKNSALVNVKRVSYNCFVCLYEPVISDCIAGKDLMSERGEENEKKRLV